MAGPFHPWHPDVRRDPYPTWRRLREAAPLVRVRLLGAWAAGFGLYQWIQPTGPSWWTDVVAGIPGAGEVTVGASLPAFALAFVLYAGVRSAHAPLGRRRARLAGSR